MFCAECGKAIPTGGRFCPACGRPADGDEAAPPSPPPVPPVPVYPAYSPPPIPPRRRHEGLIPGIVTAVIIVAAGLGVGLYLGLKDDGKPATATTVPIVAASTTTAPPSTTTTAAPTTTTTSLVTTTSELTTTTESPTAVLTRRAGAWMDLLESIPTSSQDLTAQIAAFLTPKDQAQARAAKYVESWTTPPNPEDIIKSDPWDSIATVMVGPDKSRAITVATLKLECRDGLTTRGLVANSWQLDGGEWLHTVSPEPPAPAGGSLAPFGGAVKSGDLLWSPVTLHELKHLGVGGGPTAKGMFVTVEFFVRNEGQNDVTPGGWQIFAVDSSGKEYGLSSTADDYWYNDVEARAIPLLPGESSWIWFTFEVPAGLDLGRMQFRVGMPTL